jgi:hypothetical protein
MFNGVDPDEGWIAEQVCNNAHSTYWFTQKITLEEVPVPNGEAEGSQLLKAQPMPTKP